MKVSDFYTQVKMPIATTANPGLVRPGEGLDVSLDGTIAVSVDRMLSGISTNPIQNKVVHDGLSSKLDSPSGGVSGQVLSKTDSGSRWIDLPESGLSDVHGIAVEALSSVPPLWLESDIGRVFRWVGDNGSGYLRGSLYLIDREYDTSLSSDVIRPVPIDPIDRGSVVMSVNGKSPENGNLTLGLSDLAGGSDVAMKSELDSKITDPDQAESSYDRLLYKDSSGAYSWISPSEVTSGILFDNDTIVLDEQGRHSVGSIGMNKVNGLEKSLSAKAESSYVASQLRLKADQSSLSEFLSANQIRELVESSLVGSVRIRGVLGSSDELNAALGSSSAGDLYFVRSSASGGDDMFGEHLCVEESGVKRFELIGGIGGSELSALSSRVDLLSSSLEAKQDRIGEGNKVPAIHVSGLSDVATSGDYNSLINRPEIPVMPNVSDASVEFKLNGSSAGSFTLNQENNGVIELSGLVTSKELYSALSSKADIGSVPTKVSDLTDASSYALSSDIHDTEVEIRKGSLLKGSFTLNQGGTSPVSIDLGEEVVPMMQLIKPKGGSHLEMKTASFGGSLASALPFVSTSGGVGLELLKIYSSSEGIWKGVAGSGFSDSDDGSPISIDMSGVKSIVSVYYRWNSSDGKEGTWHSTMFPMSGESLADGSGSGIAFDGKTIVESNGVYSVNEIPMTKVTNLISSMGGKLSKPVSDGVDGQVLTCLNGEPIWSDSSSSPSSSSLSCRMIPIQSGWYDPQTKKATIPGTNFPVIGVKAPASAGGRYYPIEKNDCAIADSSVTLDMSRYLTYENVDSFADGWAAYIASGVQNGKVIEVIDTAFPFTSDDAGRVFQWNGSTNGTYVRGHFYRVEADGTVADCTAQTFHSVEPVEVPSGGLTVKPFQCYEWTVGSQVTMGMEGWSSTGEEWSTVYIRVLENGIVKGADGITFVDPLVKGKMNYCRIRGYKGRLRVFVLDSYSE